MYIRKHRRVIQENVFFSSGNLDDRIVNFLMAVIFVNKVTHLTMPLFIKVLNIGYRSLNAAVLGMNVERKS
jgi:hypothetical protein